MSSGVAVGRMSSKFSPPQGEIVAVRVAAMMVRHARRASRRSCEEASRGSWCCRRSSTCRGEGAGSGWEAADRP